MMMTMNVVQELKPELNAKGSLSFPERVKSLSLSLSLCFTVSSSVTIALFLPLISLDLEQETHSKRMSLLK